MKRFLGNIREKLVQKKSVNKSSSDDFDFWWNMEKVWEDSYIFESYGQQTKIEKYDEELFTIWGIVESEKNIKLVADFMNRGKKMATEWYNRSDKSILHWVLFAYYDNIPNSNVDVVFALKEFDKSDSREYEWLWNVKAIPIIESKIFKKMGQPEKNLIFKNKATIVKYLNDRAKETHIYEIENEESVADKGA